MQDSSRFPILWDVTSCWWVEWFQPFRIKALSPSWTDKQRSGTAVSRQNPVTTFLASHKTEDDVMLTSYHRPVPLLSHINPLQNFLPNHCHTDLWPVSFKVWIQNSLCEFLMFAMRSTRPAEPTTIFRSRTARHVFLLHFLMTCHVVSSSGYKPSRCLAFSFRSTDFPRKQEEIDETVRLVCLSVWLTDSHPTFSIKDVPVFAVTSALFCWTVCRAQKCSADSVLQQKEYSDRVSTLQPGFIECLHYSLYLVCVYTAAWAQWVSRLQAVFSECLHYRLESVSVCLHRSLGSVSVETTACI